MSTLVLSLLLLVLVAVGLMMGTKVVERFANPEAPAVVPVSPALKNMMTPTVTAPTSADQTELTREQEVQAARAAPAEKLVGPDGEEHILPAKKPSGSKPAPEPAPGCPVCPDMSQYIRLDEVPCWNCTLP